MRLDFPQQIKYKNGLLSTCTMHIYIQFNRMIIETTSLPMKAHSIYPVAVEDLDLHYTPSLSLYWLLPMQLVVEYSCQLGFYQMVHYKLMIWWTETAIQCWEQEVEIQILMRVHYCYTTRNNSEVTLRHAVVVMPDSTQTHQPYIHKYCDFHYWWTAVEWYLKDQLKANRALNKLATHVLYYVKSWMTVDEPRTAWVY